MINPALTALRLQRPVYIFCHRYLEASCDGAVVGNLVLHLYWPVSEDNNVIFRKLRNLIRVYICHVGPSVHDSRSAVKSWSILCQRSGFLFHGAVNEFVGCLRGWGGCEGSEISANLLKISNFIKTSGRFVGLSTLATKWAHNFQPLRCLDHDVIDISYWIFCPSRLYQMAKLSSFIIQQWKWTLPDGFLILGVKWADHFWYRMLGSWWYRNISNLIFPNILPCVEVRDVGSSCTPMFIGSGNQMGWSLLISDAGIMVISISQIWYFQISCRVMELEMWDRVLHPCL
jgi:hypothetical protein